MDRDNKLGLALIGTFLIVGVVLAFLLTTLIGGGSIGSNEQRFISYFTGSVKGLNVGAQVSFRGARVGKVETIGLLYDQKDDTVSIPVTMSIDRTALGSLRNIGDPEREGLAVRLIERGLAAQLALESIVTGQLYVQLDFHPDAKPQYFMPDPPFPEIPTVPSKLEILQQKLENIPLDRIASSLESSLAGLESVVNSADTKETIKSVQLTAKHSDELMVELTDLVQSSRPKIGTLLDSMDRTATSFASTGSETEIATRDLSRELKRLMPKVELLLSDLSQSARSVTRLSDTLERQPEAVLKGKR